MEVWLYYPTSRLVSSQCHGVINRLTVTCSVRYTQYLCAVDSKHLVDRVRYCKLCMFGGQNLSELPNIRSTRQSYVSRHIMKTAKLYPGRSIKTTISVSFKMTNEKKQRHKQGHSQNFAISSYPFIRWNSIAVSNLFNLSNWVREQSLWGRNPPPPKNNLKKALFLFWSDLCNFVVKVNLKANKIVVRVELGNILCFNTEQYLQSITYWLILILH